MLILYILLGVYAVSVAAGLAYPTFMEGVAEGRGEPYFIKTSEMEEAQKLFFYWPFYILLALVVAPIALALWLIRQPILLVGRLWGKTQ
jgi:hypothetical protein